MPDPQLRYDWSIPEIEAIYTLPLPDLIFRAQTAHRRYHHPNQVQACSLLSIKTGGCPEDCAYCPQSARYQTQLERSSLMSVAEVFEQAFRAREQGATRFCLGAAWREAPEGESFARVLEMVRAVRSLSLEACCTLGMLSESQAHALADAGLSAYNHNLDTSPEFYGQIITTRTYQDRLRTLGYVRRAGITVCCGGIIGMGESRQDRCSLLAQLARQRSHPESVPINLLVRVAGTPLANQKAIDPFELVRTIATARILMPASRVRLSAGRTFMSDETQALCFLAGVNSIFIGEHLLTTPNPEPSDDERLLARLGMYFAEGASEKESTPAKSTAARSPIDHSFGHHLGGDFVNDSGELERRVRTHLGELETAGMKRYLQIPHGVSFSSNDYLGLANHPRVKARMMKAVERDGCGSTGSRLLSGNREAFTSIERRFAHWKGTDAALFFGSGYLANLGVLSTFLEHDDVVFSDELNHASLIDGIRLSKARKIVFRHADLDDLTRLIERNHGAGQKFLVTESIFSMDGDEAPLADYAALCQATNTALIVDEAHAVGVYGPSGSGLIEETGIGTDVFLSINPAGKALGVGGAFVAGSAWAIDYLLQRARTLIFSTAPPPAMAEALEASLDLIRDEPERRARLLDLSVKLRELLIGQGIQVIAGLSQIVPVIIGESETAVDVAELLQVQGFDVRAIRPPSVAPGTCRLRLSVNVNLAEGILEEFSHALAETLNRHIGVAA